MKLKTHLPTSKSAVALVITLLMLSVITFLAIAFLAMTARDKSAVTTSLDVDTARSMSDAALARAQAGIIAQMMSATDILSYDYSASHNFINGGGFKAGETFFDPTNVNYDYLAVTGNTFNSQDGQDWAQNINNLFYDPRPPVFVMVNGNQSAPVNDFRFWVDINRNRRFETNGAVQTTDQYGNAVPGSVSLVNGEPEWIGVLKYPETNHSASNPFIGRYAYMVLPIGKTLDWNYIYNHSKFAATGKDPDITGDGYIRDEGVGSWELNLAALLNDISPAMYQTNQNYTGANAYNYVPSSSSPNGGYMAGAFFDASRILAFRYGTNGNYPLTLNNIFGTADVPQIGVTAIDEYGTYPSTTYPMDFNQYSSLDAIPTGPWPGSYNSNMMYDVQDLFDPTKTGPYFPGDLANAVSLLDTGNRYAFQTLLGCIGTDSSPEYGVYVYSNFFSTNVSGPAQPGYLPIPQASLLRTKVNINYDNTAQIQAGPVDAYGKFTPMPTNLVTWTNSNSTGINFFTNAADLLLRSQVFVFTNYVLSPQGQYIPDTAANNTTVYTSFGLTNIPVYNPTNPGIVYNEQVHRMLQVAANIFAAAYPSYINSVPQPPVFRPEFSLVQNPSGGNNVFIIGYVPVTGTTAFAQINKGFKNLNDPTIQLDDNVWGIPWVVGAVKGIPQFDQFTYQNQVFINRQLLFVRAAAGGGKAVTTTPPLYTNQFFIMSISNLCAIDAWNPYTNNFIGSSSSGELVVVASNFVTITVTNNFNWGTNVYITNTTPGVQAATNVVQTTPFYWPGGTRPSTSMFKTFWSNLNVALPEGYLSETVPKHFVPITNINGSFWLPSDTNQTTLPTYNWSMTVTNHLMYMLLDGAANQGNVLDFVNLGPFGSTFPISQYLINPQYDSTYSAMWVFSNAPGSINQQASAGVINQIGTATTYPNGNAFKLALNGQPTSSYGSNVSSFAPPPPAASTSGGPLPAAPPFAIYADSNSWMACDPLVHYTVGDLYSSATSIQSQNIQQLVQYQNLANAMTLGTGNINPRYTNGAANGNGSLTSVMLYGDPGVTSPNAWQFPTGRFPSVGWLGRVHRGTPWQTIYLKPDDPAHAPGWSGVANNVTPWVNSPYTYPTNDWSLIDLFTAVPNDNAARGLLSVNQTNDAAWAAVFAGIIAVTNNSTVTNTTVGVVISPTNDSYGFYSAAIDNIPNGMNYIRSTNQNGLFHHVGDILRVPALTTNSPYLAGVLPSQLTDEMVERVPQQTLGLLKVGMPQFVIYAWGQSLKPKNLYSGGSANLNNICTNYEITGEFLTRTVCHVVTPDGTASAPKIVVDNYNIMPGN